MLPQQAIVAESVRELAREMPRQGGLFPFAREEMEKVGRLLMLPGTHTPNCENRGAAGVKLLRRCRDYRGRPRRAC